MIAALYIRVSTHDQEELSPDSQKNLLIQYAKDHGYEISMDHIYVDGGISGRKAEKRPEFMRLIADAKKKPAPFGAILVWKFSRFARNQEESIVYKSMLAKQCGVDVISISEPIIDGPFGSLIERIIEWMDEYYSIRLSGEVHRGLTEKAKRGGYVSKTPIGYIMKDRKAIVDPENAEMVKNAFRLALAGYDPTSIARKINDDMITTSCGNPWEGRTVKYMLQNPFYTGKIRWDVPSGNPIVTQADHEPIISQEDFDTVQELLNAKFAPAKHRAASGCGFVYSGIIKCSVCGCSLSVSGSHGDIYRYYNCIGYTKGKHRGSQSVPEKTLNDAIMNQLTIDATSDNDISYTVRSAVAEEPENNSIDKMLAKLTDRENRCKIAYQEGIDTLEEYKANKAKIAEERKRLEAKKADAKKAPVDIVAFRQKLRSVVDLVQDNSIDIEIRNNAVKSIIEKIVWNKAEREISIFYLV